MIMADEEILKEYRGAKDQKKQIGILADLNCVPRADMAQWLADHGEIIDKRSTRYATKKSEPEEVYTVEIPAVEVEEKTGCCLTAEEAVELKDFIDVSVEGMSFGSMPEILLFVRAYKKLAEVCG